MMGISRVLLLGVLAFVLLSVVAHADVTTTANTTTSTSSTTSVATTVQATVSAPTASNSVLDLGESETFSTVISGGVGPFNVRLIDTSTGSGATVEELDGQSAGTVVFDSFTPAYSHTYNVIATDTGAATPYSVGSGSTSITVNPALVLQSFSVSPQSVNGQQTVTFTANATGGTNPVTYDWYSDAACTNRVYHTDSGVLPQTVSSTTTFYVEASDGASTPERTQCSAGATVTVGQQAPTTTIVGSVGNSGGGGGGGGGSGGGGGGAITSVVEYSGPGPNSTGYEILNFTQGGTKSFTIGGKTFTVTLNFISPSSAQVTINGNQYTLSPGSTVLLEDPPTYKYYVQLVDISYLPILQSLDLAVYGEPVQAPVTTTVAPTTTVQTTTVQTTTVTPAQVHAQAAAHASATGIAAASPNAAPLVPSIVTGIGGFTIAGAGISNLRKRLMRGPRRKSGSANLSGFEIIGIFNTVLMLFAAVLFFVYGFYLPSALASFGFGVSAVYVYDFMMSFRLKKSMAYASRDGVMKYVENLGIAEAFVLVAAIASFAYAAYPLAILLAMLFGVVFTTMVDKAKIRREMYFGSAAGMR